MVTNLKQVQKLPLLATLWNGLFAELVELFFPSPGDSLPAVGKT
jgi:hypothetical protein